MKSSLINHLHNQTIIVDLFPQFIFSILDEATNDKKTSTEMELVKNDDDGKGMDKEEFLEDEKAILGKYIRRSETPIANVLIHDTTQV